MQVAVWGKGFVGCGQVFQLSPLFGRKLHVSPLTEIIIFAAVQFSPDVFEGGVVFAFFIATELFDELHVIGSTPIEHSRFGQFFPEPKMLATETPRIHSLADPDKKMSKSLGPKHYIGMFEDENSVRAKIKAAVTDSGILHPGVAMSPGVTTLFEILKACGKDTEVNALLKEYESGNRQYSRLKDAVADALVELTRKFSKKRVELMRDHDAVMQTVREMSVQAHEIARSTLREVRALVGLPKKL